MALSEDQKAMLRLLAQRGEQGYEDLSALMGIGVDEVHAKALEAAAELEAEGIPAPAIPPPPGSAPAATPPPVPVERAPEPEPETQSPPSPPPEPAKPTAKPSPKRPKRTPPPRPKVSLPGGGAGAALAAGTLVVIALVLVLVLSGGEDSGDSSGGTSAGGTASQETVNAANDNGKEVTQAILDPVDGSDATGLAAFGRIKNSLALQVEASGLEPTGKGESYTIWLYQSPQKMLPLASTGVGEQGKIAAQVEVPTEVLAYLANETFDQINISRTSNATLKASLAKATREKKAPIYTGNDVLRGLVTGPIVGAAKK
jgi:hypothetical protein